jgi:DNA-binding CsgD family transcriptional regulator
MTMPKPSVPSRRRSAERIEGLSAGGLDLGSFRTEALRSLRSSVPADAAFFASVDPTTLLFTSALAEPPLAAATAQFLDNEYARQDVNKFAWLAAAADKLGSLDRATNGDRAASARYREVLAPLGLGDEMRVALVVGGLCWGVLCLHRSVAANGFDAKDIDFVRRVAPDLARGLRHSVTLSPATPKAPSAGGPGIVILDSELAIVSLNPAAEALLADIVEADWPAHLELPVTVFAAAAAELSGGNDGEGTTPSVTRLRRRSGGWVTVQGSALRGGTSRQVALVLAAADTSYTSSLVLAAHGLTAAQSRVVGLVLQGRSTPSIVKELHISANTLQEHLHAVFEKFGIGSRRELVAALSARSH